jgi:hypothetical protein
VHRDDVGSRPTGHTKRGVHRLVESFAKPVRTDELPIAAGCRTHPDDATGAIRDCRKRFRPPDVDAGD